ncbi:MAG: hypothetical protein AB7V56_09230 [Candidatus Nitrosocosmicus sp.]|uniref:PDC sensor domain-containing protein n=1 Tax=Candidatus Nitrosocosmicus agrestis TaxID=2563600 RepID=UPI001331B44F|nr:hypothetical protein [Candidatus Nitrosocosmicus sp. SS]MDR4491656.1 hypothetical protein [Candidatus Nitrosocosmicus sp.]
MILSTIVILFVLVLSINYTLTFALDNSATLSNSTGITNQGFSDEKIRLEQFSNFVTSKLNETISTLQVASENHILNNFDYKANVSEVLHGLPNDMEKSKRDFLSDIIKSNPDIASIFLVLPNGNIYLGEPFSDQKQLPRLNFADREWYKGVNLKDGLYVSTVFSSAAINAPAIAVAIPIINSQSNGTSIQYNGVQSDKAGYLVAIMDFNYTRELLFKYSDNTNDTFNLVDRNGTELINSNNSTYSTDLKSFYYKSIINSDKNLKTIKKYEFNDEQGTKFIYLMPVTITGNTWYMVMISPR